MTKEVKKRKYHVKRVNGHLHKVIPVLDSSGKIMQYALKPLMVELHLRDIMQIIVGSVILAIPVGMTEEVWHLGNEMKMLNFLFLTLLSLLFVAMFVYYNFYRHHLHEHRFDFIKRVIATYIISATVVALFLTIIGKCPWGIDNIVAIKRIIIVAFPASMSATLSDTIK